MPPPLPPSAAKTPAPPAELIRGRLMAQSLGKLLDQARGAREVLPHLAALERGLLQDGTAALDRVPLHWLGRICSQLSSLPHPQGDAPLIDLLRRLAAKLEMQRNDWSPDDMVGSERTVVIREISHSEFAAAEAEQQSTVVTPRL